jgi:HK97 family phage portal protein
MSRRSKQRQKGRANMALKEELGKERRLTLQDGQAWAAAFGHESYAGKSVTLKSAMQLSTFWACVRLTAQAVSCLPLGYFEKQAQEDRVAVEDDISAVLCESPNIDQTPLEFWEGNVAWLLVDGNAYSEKVTVGKRLTALQPMPSDHCRPFRKPDDTLVYRFSDRGKTEELPRDKVFHLKGFGFGGDSGLSAVRYGVQSFGSAIAINEAAGRLYGKGLHASGVLTTANNATLDKDQREELQDIMEDFVGSPNAAKLMILEGGMKFERLSLSPVDAQMLENMRFSVEEICRWVGMPPIIIGHAAQGQTMWGSGVEQILLAWLTLGIDPLCDRIEERIKKQLIRPTGNKRRYAEFNREALLQMDSAAKAAFLSMMTQNGLMTRNEGRAKLNLPWKQGGDELTAQTNLAPLDKLGAGMDGAQARAAMRAWLGVQAEERQAA